MRTGGDQEDHRSRTGAPQEEDKRTGGGQEEDGGRTAGGQEVHRRSTGGGQEDGLSHRGAAGSSTTRSSSVQQVSRAVGTTEPTPSRHRQVGRWKGAAAAGTR